MTQPAPQVPVQIGDVLLGKYVVERVIGDADGRLRLLNARLDEAAARTIELSVQAHDVTELGGLGDDVDEMVDEMEALRQAIEETGGGTAAAGSA